jgi:hypothetical protein
VPLVCSTTGVSALANKGSRLLRSNKNYILFRPFKLNYCTKFWHKATVQLTALFLYALCWHFMTAIEYLRLTTGL